MACVFRSKTLVILWVKTILSGISYRTFSPLTIYWKFCTRILVQGRTTLSQHHMCLSKLSVTNITCFPFEKQQNHDNSECLHHGRFMFVLFANFNENYLLYNKDCSTYFNFYFFIKIIKNFYKMWLYLLYYHWRYWRCNH